MREIITAWLSAIGGALYASGWWAFATLNIPLLLVVCVVGGIVIACLMGVSLFYIYDD